MNTGVIAVTAGGRRLADSIAASLDGAGVLQGDSVAALLASHWRRLDGFVCIMAAGIAVRAVAPLLGDKRTDPCVVVLDERGEHVISLLSGHLGGGNELARQVALLTGGRAVITTASDTLGLAALDLWARRQGLAVAKDILTALSARLVNAGVLCLCADVPVVSLPSGLVTVSDRADADFFVSVKRSSGKPSFVPRMLVLGTGCNRGTPAKEFAEAFDRFCAGLGIDPDAVRAVASIEQKRDEQGLRDFAGQRDLQTLFFDRQLINRVTGVTVSEAALRAVGAIGVAEPCALLGAELLADRDVGFTGDFPLDASSLFCRKRTWQNITMALAAVPFTLSEPDPGRRDT